MPALTPEFACAYRDMMIEGLNGEMQITRKVIAAVPDAASHYKPDPHARTARELAWHIANSDVQFLDGIVDLKFDMSTPEQKPETTAEIIAWYDDNMKRGIERLATMSGEQLVTPVSFAGGMFNFPAVMYLAFLNNHCIHHRGELATYLRPMGSKVPSIYGGSHDEPFAMPQPEQTAA